MVAIERAPGHAEACSDLSDGHVGGFEQCPGDSYFLGQKLYGAASFAPASACSREACNGSFTYQVAFEFGQGGKDMEDQPTC